MARFDIHLKPLKVSKFQNEIVLLRHAAEITQDFRYLS
jgi:hypothetical protein